MNAKSLIQAVRDIRDGTCDPDVRDEALSGIVESVRDDDEEPVTRDWFTIAGADTHTDPHRCYVRYWIDRDGDGVNWEPMTLYWSAGQAFLNNRMIAFIDTRGQFRALLRGLRADITF